MSDQATELRKLVMKTAREQASPFGPAPRLIAVSGGKGGVGVTTLAAGLSLALAENGIRVVLVDTDVHRADIAPLFGLSEQRSVADVLAARSDIHEVMVRGPSGVLVVPGLWAPESASTYTAATQHRLLKQLRQLGRHADIVLLDVGSGPSDIARGFWQAATDVLIVTTPEPMAVMDSYAMIKTLVPEEEMGRLHLIVNQADSASLGADVHRRVDQSCQRFLGFSIERLGHVPRDERLATTLRGRTEILSQVTTSPALAAIERLAVALSCDQPNLVAEGRRAA